MNSGSLNKKELLPEFTRLSNGTYDTNKTSAYSKGFKKSSDQFDKKTNINKTNQRRVKFREKGFIDLVYVESFKKYNMENVFGEDDNNSSNCKCLIF